MINLYMRGNLSMCAARLLNRLRHLNPFPCMVNDDPYDTMMAFVDPHIAECVRRIDETGCAYRGVLEYGQWCDLSYTLSNAPTRVIRFSFGGILRPVFRQVKHDAPPLYAGSPHYDEVIGWTVVASARAKAIDETLQFINHLIDVLNTPGQWNRVFPAFVNFMPPDMQEEARSSRRASRMPPGLDRAYVSKHIEKAEEDIATALLLPSTPPRIWIK